MQDREIAPFVPTERPGAARLNMIRDIALSVGTISGGGATEVMQLPHGTSVFTPPAPPQRIGTFPVRVVQVGGAAGTSTTAATWTYDVYRPTGNPADAVTAGTKLTTAAPINLRNVSDGQRPKGLLLAGDNYGLAFYDGTTLILWDAGEKEDTAVGCTA